MISVLLIPNEKLNKNEMAVNRLTGCHWLSSADIGCDRSNVSKEIPSPPDGHFAGAAVAKTAYVHNYLTLIVFSLFLSLFVSFFAISLPSL